MIAPRFPDASARPRPAARSSEPAAPEPAALSADSSARIFQILILPRLEVACRDLTLREAAAWMRTYNAIMQDDPRRAVIRQVDRM